MSGFTTKEVGCVHIEHYSTASQIKISITQNVEVSQGVFEDVTEEVWVDYQAFEDLIKAANQTEFA